MAPASALTAQRLPQEMVWHSSGGKDWYTLHLALNALAFVYAAARCHGLVAAHGAAPLDSLAKSHTISAAYLVALIVVFSGIAADRFIYSVGSTRARGALLLAEVLLYFAATAVLMWRSVLDDDNRWHLKVCPHWSCDMCQWRERPVRCQCCAAVVGCQHELLG